MYRTRVLTTLLAALSLAIPAVAEESLAKRERRIRIEKKVASALTELRTARTAEAVLRAADALASTFPRSRKQLTKAAATGSERVRRFAVKILGEQGEADKDLEAVTTRLGDSSPKVRLAAVMATQKLGADGLEAVLRYLPAEKVANNRKMAIKTLQRWDDPDAVEPLIDLLGNERDRGVRNFLFKALRWITEEKIGDDVAAWMAHGEQLRTLRLAEQLGVSSKDTAEKE